MGFHQDFNSKMDIIVMKPSLAYWGTNSEHKPVKAFSPQGSYSANDSKFYSHCSYSASDSNFYSHCSSSASDSRFYTHSINRLHAILRDSRSTKLSFPGYVILVTDSCRTGPSSHCHEDLFDHLKVFSKESSTPGHCGQVYSNMDAARWMKTTVSMLLFMLLVHFQGGSTSTGKSFLVAFPKSDHSTPNVLLTSTDGKATRVHVVSPTKNQVSHIGGSNPISLNVQLPSALVMEGSKKYRHAWVSIEADNDILVHALTLLRATGRSSSAAFLVLPVQYLSTYYTTLTYCPQNSCLIVVASPHKDSAVEVTLNFVVVEEPDSGSGAVRLSYDGRSYRHGDVIKEKLQEHEIMQILGVQVDLTGSKVTSSQPVAVISGSDFTRFQSGLRADAMLEMMPPVVSLGQTYVIPAFKDAKDGTWVFVVMPDPATVLSYPETIQPTESTPARYIFRLPPNQTLILSANRPVLVASSPPSSGNANTYFDPSMVLHMPENTWKHSYTVPTFRPSVAKPKYAESVLVLFFANPCPGPIFLGNVDIAPRLPSTATEDSRFQTVTWAYTADQAFTLRSPSCRIGGYLSESFRSQAMSVPLGWDSQVTDTETTSSISTSAIAGTEATTEVVYSETVSIPTVTTSTDTSTSSQEFSTSGEQIVTTSLVPETTSESETTTMKKTNAPTNTATSKSTELKLCPCQCNKLSLNVSIISSAEEKMKIKKSITKQLAVNQSSLSSAVRRKTSILILQPTSTFIGSVMAGAVMAVVAAFIVIPDLMVASHFLLHLFKRLF